MRFSCVPLLLAFLAGPASGAELSADIELTARVSEAGALSGAVTIRIAHVPEPLRAVVTVELRPTAEDRSWERIAPATTSFEVESDGSRTLELDRDLVCDTKGLAAGEYRVVAGVLLRGMDSWAQARAETRVTMGSSPRPGEDVPDAPAEEAAAPAGGTSALPGLHLRDEADGVVIERVESEILRKLGFRAGDRIAWVVLPDGLGTERKVASIRELEKVVATVKSGAVLFGVVRGEELLILPWLGDDEDLPDEPGTEPDPAALGGLLARLESEDAGERADAALEIGILGEGALPALPALIRALSDSSSEVRAAAASSIGGIGAVPEQTQAIPALLGALRDEKAQVRIEVAATLRGVVMAAVRGDDLRRVEAALARAAKDDPDPTVRAIAGGE